MNSDNREFAKSTVAPIGAGLLTTFVAKILLPIPKELSIFQKSRGSEVLAGLVDGIGNVRNLVATAIGGVATVATFLILNKEDIKKNAHLNSIGESFTVQKDPRNSAVLEVTGRAEYGNGGQEEIKTVLRIADYEALCRIAQRLADETPKIHTTANLDKSNILNGMRLALLKSVAQGWDISWFDAGTCSYEAAKKVAFSNQSRPAPELMEMLISAMTTESETLRPCSTRWAARATESTQELGKPAVAQR